MNTSLRTASVADLHAKTSTGGPVVMIDVRSGGEFAGGHIAGARNLPLGSPELAAFARERPGDAVPVYVLCASGGRSLRACEALAAAGLGHAISVEGGTAAWSAAGLPLVREAGARGVIALERQVRIAAGALVLIGCGLGFGLHAVFYGLAAFVGAGLVFAGITDFCGMGLLLARMPWNRRG